MLSLLALSFVCGAAVTEGKLVYVTLVSNGLLCFYIFCYYARKGVRKAEERGLLTITSYFG